MGTGAPPAKPAQVDLANSGRRRKQAAHLREALNELGTTFIDWARRSLPAPDLLPAEYIEELGKLQDEVPPMPFEKMAENVGARTGPPHFRNIR